MIKLLSILLLGCLHTLAQGLKQESDPGFQWYDQYYEDNEAKTTDSKGSRSISDCDCGLVNRSPSLFRVVGGQKADKNEYPWQVGLVWSDAKQPFCGGTLISSRHVLTAAHCIDAETSGSFKVLLGEHDFKDDIEGLRVNVQTIMPHPQYKKPKYDFGLITLATPVKFSTKIRPACLPANTKEEYLNKNVIITGWGKLDFRGERASTLMEAKLKVTNMKACSKAFKTTLQADLHVCAADDRRGTCNGDSGGPLVVKDNSRYTVIGVSTGSRDPCAEFPTLFARVAKVLPWILEHTEGTHNSKCEPIKI